MELFLDDQPIPVTENENATLSEVITRVSNDLKESNRVVAGVVVDNVQCGDWERDPYGQRKIKEVTTMHLTSEEPRRLAIRVLYDIAKYMPRIQNALVEVSSRLQSRREEEAMELLSNVARTWSDLYEGLGGSIAVLGIEMAEVQAEGASLDEVHTQILQLLDDASDHINEQRLLELSDLLEYELAPKMPVLEEAIYVLIREAERRLH